MSISDNRKARVGGLIRGWFFKIRDSFVLGTIYLGNEEEITSAFWRIDLGGICSIIDYKSWGDIVRKVIKNKIAIITPNFGLYSRRGNRFILEYTFIAASKNNGPKGK